ncbi:MAG: ABC transporter permease [Oscillospiraceae bacterium]|nr:ABC transporter permease [Oscillospiraceae bacterium]
MEQKMEAKTQKAPAKKADARLIGNLAPIAGLVLVIVVFSVLTRGALLSSTNLQALASSVITTAMCAIGAVFVFGAGYFDMSMGGSLCIAAVLGAKVMIASGSYFLGFVVILLISLVLAIVKGLLASYVNIPFFIFTIILSSIFSAIVLVIMGNETTVSLSSAVSEMRSFNFTEISVISVIVLALFFALCLVAFNYTPLGVKTRNMGGNIVSARQSGIDTTRTTLTVFLMGGLGVALAALLLLMRTRTADASMGGTLGTDVMVALVLGGMPLSGGPRSKISAGLIGAVTITVLNSGLAIMGLGTGQIQATRGIVFIVVVLVSSLSYRGKLLPR